MSYVASSYPWPCVFGEMKIDKVFKVCFNAGIFNNLSEYVYYLPYFRRLGTSEILRRRRVRFNCKVCNERTNFPTYRDRVLVNAFEIATASYPIRRYGIRAVIIITNLFLIFIFMETVKKLFTIDSTYLPCFKGFYGETLEQSKLEDRI